MAEKVTPFNPLDYMSTDEEIIEFLLDCYRDDETGIAYQGALRSVYEARGFSAVCEFVFEVTKRIAEQSRSK